MEDFMREILLCQLQAKIIYNYLCLRIPDRVGDLPQPESHAFQVPLNRSDGDYFLSIAYPPDCHEVETALFDSSGLIYRESCGYSDIRRGFGSGDPSDPETITALVDEIRRMDTVDLGSPPPEYDEPDENYSYRE
tara:strand:- start:1426 stop:1830 length:405 start_codon:yes stop_codon:yes gene_type:complete